METFYVGLYRIDAREINANEDLYFIARDIRPSKPKGLIRDFPAVNERQWKEMVDGVRGYSGPQDGLVNRLTAISERTK